MFPNGKLKNFLNKIGKKPNVKNISLTIDKIQENDKEWFYNDTATQIIPTLVHIITGIHIDKYLVQNRLNYKTPLRRQEESVISGFVTLTNDQKGYCLVRRFYSW